MHITIDSEIFLSTVPGIVSIRGKGGGTPRNNIFFNFLVMNLFNKFSMLKKPNLSYIFKLVAGDNYS